MPSFETAQRAAYIGQFAGVFNLLSKLGLRSAMKYEIRGVYYGNLVIKNPGHSMIIKDLMELEYGKE